MSEIMLDNCVLVTVATKHLKVKKLLSANVRCNFGSCVCSVARLLACPRTFFVFFFPYNLVRECVTESSVDISSTVPFSYAKVASL